MDQLEISSAPEPAAPSSTSQSPPYRRRLGWPLFLFLLTCLSTFWAGTSTVPYEFFWTSLDSVSLMPIRRVVWANYENGIIYMAAVIGILLAHEMGHFVVTLIYRVPASYPIFLPLPFTPIGTCGAVIRMDGRYADRRQIFDIGLAGPLAGLLVAIPVMWWGVRDLALNAQNGLAGVQLNMPLGIRWLVAAIGPEAVQGVEGYWLGQLAGNPLFVAGWVGFLITGLNMLPISQLDGGHVIYCLFGRRSRWIARGMLVGAMIFIVVAKAYAWALMVLIILFIGPDHPPTRNDHVRLGFFRVLLGLLSLAIPILCLPAQPITQ